MISLSVSSLYTSILLLLPHILPILASPTSNTKRFTGTKYLFTFGDSYSQTGFTPTSTAPSAANPIGNPAFPGYTTDNGKNWIGYLISQYNTSLTLSYNFASGGATVDASLVAPYESTVLSLIDQVSEFSNDVIAAGKSGSVWTASDSLFGVWIGVNDVGNSYGNSGESTLLSKILTVYFQQLSILYSAGARNFILLTVPPIYKTPLMLAQSSTAQSEEETVISEWNTLLKSSASSFQSSKSGSTVTIYDTTTPFNTAIANPTAYGASSSGATCYNSDGVSCLWWNNYHPGQAIHKLVAAGVAGSLSGSFF